MKVAAWLLAAAVTLLCFLVANSPGEEDECTARGGNYELVYVGEMPIVYCTQPPERQPHDR